MQKRWIWPFELEEQLGAGGMGVVYKARFVKNDRRVALKLLPEDVASNPVLTARFERELEILKDLRHPGIVHCFGGTCEGAQRFYAMELVEGGTVESLLKERGRLPWELAIEYGLQICAALDYAHGQGIIHRDIKPANLLLTKAGRLKLGDFGLALVAAGQKLTCAGKTLGTLHYMAPEQIRGNPPLSNRTDLYAFGCVLFEMLTGAAPFNGEAAAEILNKHLQQAPPRVSATALDCPPVLDELVSDLLQKDPARRPESAAAVAARLEAVTQATVARSPTRRIQLDAERTRVVERVQATAAWEEETGIATKPSGLSPRRKRGLAASGILALLLVVWFFSGTPQRGLDSRSTELWIRALHERDPAVRIYAARSLGELGPDAKVAVSALIESLNDSDPLVRLEGAIALGKIGGEAGSSVPAILRMQKLDPNPNVRSEAQRAIRQINAPQTGSSSFKFWFLGAALLCGGAWYWHHRGPTRTFLSSGSSA